MDPGLRALPAADHARAVVAAATRALHLRTTTQIDALVADASEAVQQRWDFLGPATGGGAPPDARLFAQIDAALEWQPGSGAGDCIRDAHFALELTEHQQEVLHPGAVRFEVPDPETVRAYAPFAAGLAVVLVWERAQWRYHDACRLDADHARRLAPTVAEACAAFAARAATSDASDDAYWDQFPSPEPQPAPPKPRPAEDSDDEYWSRHAGARADPASADPAPALVARSAQLALAAAAAAARVAGMDEAEFLAAARRHYAAAAQP
ncbi:hypothetical protein H4R18_004347 [Coemansia javaensis]|uniref:Uncharacterized protein n=1 Tax=Coemansia javaensis TaxID=2761396 RepID=A0A9W8LGD3_9FUNG|nr:hypothetical protein H4R18_004347 [Coemansia javaensis]